MMTIPEIIEALNHPPPETFPTVAFEEAIAQRGAITPDLLLCLDQALADPTAAAERPDDMLLFYAPYLLAQFRETRAYAPLIKLASIPGELPFQLLGDTITGSLDRILGSVYDGNSDPLRYLVENENVDEYVRCAAIETFLTLVNSGQMARETAVDYFRELFRGKLERKNSFAWNGLAMAISDLPAPELVPELRQAYEEGLVNPDFVDFAQLEQRNVAPDPTRSERHQVITNAIAELEPWAVVPAARPEAMLQPEFPGFANQFPPQPPVSYEPPAPYAPPQPYVRGPKIGRNDPCPCGSGKKYKKCCG